MLYPTPISLFAFLGLLHFSYTTPVVGSTSVLGAGALCGPNVGPFADVQDCLYISEHLFPHDTAGADPRNPPQWSRSAEEPMYRVPIHITHGTCRIDFDLIGGSKAALAMWAPLPNQVRLLSRFCWGRVEAQLKDFRGGTYVFGRVGQIRMKVYRNPDSHFLSSANISAIAEDVTS